ncbi:transcriptional regulator, TetR family, putative [gamma proteobacterium HTCC5015]|nr:transcriptional regulator, TetR family, putative [gamma proteobacterium HTCC5015]
MSNQCTHKKGRVYAGETADERLEKQRQQFLKAGLKLFGSKGYQSTSVRALCREAGLTDRYFYKNFKDKEALLSAVYSRAFEHIEARILDAVAPKLAERDHRGLIQAGLDAFFQGIEDPQITKVCWQEILGVSPSIDQLYTQKTLAFAELLLSYAAMMEPTIDLLKEERQAVGMALVGSVNQSALHWYLSNYQLPRATLVDVNARILFAALSEYSAD